MYKAENDTADPKLDVPPGAPNGDVHAGGHDNAAASPAAAPYNAVKPTTPTLGEKAYNLGVYTGIGYFVNLFSSVAITDYFLAGGGQKYLQQGAQALNKLVDNAPKPIKETAGYNALKTLALLSGGTLLMAPIKTLEDNKRRAVFWINRQLGKTDPNCPPDLDAKPLSDLRDDQLPQIVEEPPKQTWGNALLRRGYGIAAVQSASYISNTMWGNENLENASTNWAFKNLKKLDVPAMNRLMEKDWFKRYTKLTLLDAVFTVITAGAIYLTCPPEEKAKDGQQPAVASGTPAAAPANAESGHAPEQQVAHADAPDHKTEHKPENHSMETHKPTHFADKVGRREDTHKPLAHNGNYKDMLASEQQAGHNTPSLSA